MNRSDRIWNSNTGNSGVRENSIVNRRDRIRLAVAYNGVRNIDDAIRGVVVVAGNRGGAIRIECVRQALVVFVVSSEGAGSSMADACAPAPPPASAETGSRVKNRATARMALKSRSRGVRMV